MLGGVRIGVWLVAAALATGALALVFTSSTRRGPGAGGGDTEAGAAGSPSSLEAAASGSGSQASGLAAATAAQRAGTPDDSRPDSSGSDAWRDRQLAARTGSDSRAPGGPSRATGGREEEPWGESRRPGERAPGSDDVIEQALLADPELAAELEDAPSLDEPSAEPLPSPAEILSLEEEAARTAEALGLVDPVELDMRVERRLPEGALPPDELAQARDDLRRQLLADEAIVEDLVQSRYGNTRDETTRTLARGWARSLVPSQGPEFRAKRLEGLPERLAQSETVER